MVRSQHLRLNNFKNKGLTKSPPCGIIIVSKGKESNKNDKKECKTIYY